MKLLKYILNIVVFSPLLVLGQNNICSGENIEVSTSNFNSSAGFSQNYVLVDNDGNILDHNTTGIFNSSSYGINYFGNINLYAVNTDDNSLMGTATGSTWNDFNSEITDNDICARFIGPRSFNIISKDTTIENFTSCNTFLWDVNNVTYNSSTIDYVTLSNINGCDSVIQLSLTISNESNNTTVDACDSYDWNGNTYTTSDTYTNSNGTCEDSLFLTINESYNLSITDQACNSYLWSANNTNYTISGSYIETLTTSSGCDSTLTLDLTIIDCDVTPICSGESLINPANGFNPSNSQYYILSDSLTGEIITYNLTGEFSSNDYDDDNFRTLSLYALNTNESTLIQTINNANLWSEIENDASTKCADVLGPKYFEIIPCCELAISSNIISESCEGENNGQLNLSISGNSTYSVLIDNNSFGTNTSPGDYQYQELSPNTYEIEIIDDTYPNCDTSFEFTISPGEPVYAIDIDSTLCLGDSVNINGIYYSAANPSGVQTLTSISGCDSVLSINISFIEIDITYLYPELCFGDSILINGTYYGPNNPSGLDTLTSIDGCDSILSISVTEKPEIKNGINETFCYGKDTTINGIVYNADNPTGSDTLTSFEGCDSILIINLVFLDQIINDDIIQLCTGSYVIINGVTYDGNNPTGSAQFVASNGCDSIRIIEIIEVNQIINNIEETICFGDSIVIDGVTYNEDNPVMTDTVVSSNGCDSIVNINITVLDQITGAFNETICYGDSILVNANYYSSINPSGTDTLIASNGCDSIVSINITILDQITGTFNETICYGDSILVNGNYYSSINPSGTDTLIASNGCDSIVSINITVLDQITFTFNDTICYGDSILVNDNYYGTNNPSAFDTLTASNGCDSIINISITILDQITFTLNDTICYGDSIMINGNYYDSDNPSGTDTLTASSGCDSILLFSIYQRPLNINVIDTTLCYGDFIAINGNIYNSSNPNGIDTLTTSDGCDSVIQISITELEEKNDSLNLALCYGESIVINNVTYNADNNNGTEVLTSSYGCDSTIYISVYEEAQIISFVNETICENDTFYFLNNAFHYNNQFGQIVLIANNGCDSTINVSVDFEELPSISAKLVINFDSIINLSDGYADSICDFDTLQLFGLGGVDYLWSNNIINGDTILYPFDEFYNLIGIDSNGCSNSFDFNLFIDEYCIDFNLDTSNVFTPDGDGLNDIFLMSGESFETTSLQIYNRWGQVIYENFDGKGWDGRLQSGIEAEPGTYYYMTTIKPITRQPSDILSIQGYLKLIRE